MSVPNENFRSRLSNFGVGGIVIADNEDGWVRQSEFPPILDRSFDSAGIRYLDTARGYELAEESMGQWIKSRSENSPGENFRDQLVIGTKFNPGKFESSAGVEEFIAEQLEISRKNLDVGAIDIYWLHAPNPKVPFEVILRAMDTAARAGKIKEIGLSNISVAEVEEVLQLCERLGFKKPAAIQNEYNLLVRKSSEPMLKLCDENNLAFFAFSPLAAGLLAGRYPSVSEFPEGSRWAGWKERRPLPAYWTDETFDKLKTLRSMAADVGVSTAGLALAGCVADARVNVAIIGPRNAEQVQPAEEAQGLTLSRTELHRLQDIF